MPRDFVEYPSPNHLLRPPILKVIAHAAVIVALYLAFSFVLILRRQVRPLYGNIGLAVLAAAYVYFGFIEKR